MRRLWWTVADRRLVEEGWEHDRLNLGTAIMISYRRLWHVGVRKLDCGCSRRWWSWRIALYRFPCPTHFPDPLAVTAE